MGTESSAIDTWLNSDIVRSQKTYNLKRLYELQAKFLFDQYEPTKASPSESALSFIQKLDRWVLSFDDPLDQWSAFYSLRYFFFIGQQETEELYRCAVHQRLIPWLIDLAEIDPFSPESSDSLDNELQRCWPCPITDSLRINSLLHRTDINGQELRPDWHSLRKLGDKSRIQNYAQRENLKYLILFEDFVGSGGQCSSATKYALEVFDGPVLLIPLVVCYPGDESLRTLASTSEGKLTYRPVVVLSEECLVGQTKCQSEPRSFDALRKAISNGYQKGGFNLDGGPFGYEGVGSLVSSYSNCPNNSPPIYHATSETWPYPLFPRKRRA